jgi:cell division protein FtsX
MLTTITLATCILHNVVLCCGILLHFVSFLFVFNAVSRAINKKSIEIQILKFWNSFFFEFALA